MLNLSFSCNHINPLKWLLTVLITVNIIAGSISLTAKCADVLSAQSAERTIGSRKRQLVSGLSYFGFIKTTGIVNQAISFINLSFKYFLFSANHRLRVQINENLRSTKTLSYLKNNLFYNIHLVSEKQNIPSIIS